jgi:mono/diheme cytochrome c family protein
LNKTKEKKMKQLKHIFFVAALVWIVSSCAQPGGENPGSEYIPDMGHSIAYEANYYDYYKFNTWGTEDDYHALAQPRKPVEGTIARGFAGNPDAREDMSTYAANGFVPFYYGDSEEERTRATEEIINNPYPISEEGLARGEELYNIMCGICHGEKGDGLGWLVDEKNANAKYPAQPANFLSEEFLAASNGRYYYSIMYGKNVMGAYKDKLNYEERWQVIHHIRALQAKAQGATYNSEENTLTNVEIPAKMWENSNYAELMGEEPISNEDMDQKGEQHTDHEHHNGGSGH